MNKTMAASKHKNFQFQLLGCVYTRGDIVLSNNYGITQTTSVKYSIWDPSIFACLSKPLRWFKDGFCGEGPSSIKAQESVTNPIERKVSEC